MSSASSISSRDSRKSTSNRANKVVLQKRRSVPPDQYECCTAFFWIVVYAWMWMLIRTLVLISLADLAVVWEESRPDEVNDEEHKFEVDLCLALAFWTVMFITSVTEVTNISCVRSTTIYSANAGLEIFAFAISVTSFYQRIYHLSSNVYEKQYSDDDVFISAHLLGIIGVAILLLIAMLPYPVLLFNMYRSKVRFESEDSKRLAIR